MKKLFKLLLTCIICIFTLATIYIVFVIIFSKVTEYKPNQIEPLNIVNKGIRSIETNRSLNLLSWNIGYAGLGEEMDFFYEGGKMVRPPKDYYVKCFDEINDFIGKHDSMDFILLQEVDLNSKRSYGDDQYAKLKKNLSFYNYISAVNYQSRFIPIPLQEPMGKVNSGITTFSMYQPTETQRISGPERYSWPKRMYMMKRCFLLSKYNVDNGKQLILINIHNSAYEDAEKLREAELERLKKLISAEYSKGNYVIVGGDWNQNPPSSDLHIINKYKTRTVWPIDISYLTENWTWAYDKAVPTNRDVHEPFNVQSTTSTILDYFLISPNIELVEVNTFDLDFEHSDHHPVRIKIRLLD